MEFALKAENVSIRYITGDFKDIGIKEYLTRKATHNYHVNEFMAVDGVSFTLEHGDMLGIIGTNGAGKSTLLKAVAGIMEPTRGKITANGEVAALLELGSGFDGDLTVKENAYLRGAMLGYTKEFMDQTYDHIIDFAELCEFEDRPFKQLSSGMKSRLAFSIASLVKPDILILDEVLSVGDGAFQEKSAKKMREIISQGATTILVSHSLEQIRELCNKVLWLDHGKQIAFGDVTEVCDQYARFLNGECSLPVNENAPEQNNTEEQSRLQSKEGQVKSEKSRKILSALISIAVAVFFALLVFLAGLNIFSPQNSGEEIITLYSQDLSKSVVYRGASVDGQWYNPSDTVTDCGNWVAVTGDLSTYTATDETGFKFTIPQAEQRTLTFNVGPNEGSVKVEIGNETLVFDLNQEAEVKNGVAFEIPENVGVDYTNYMYIGAILTFICVFLFMFLVVSKKRVGKNSGNKNEKKHSKRKIFFIAVAFLSFSMILVLTGLGIIRDIEAKSALEVKVTSLLPEKEVVFRGASIDGVWYNPQTLVQSADGWNFDEATFTYRAETSSKMTLDIPKGSERAVVFNTGEGQGNILLEISGQTTEYSLSDYTYSDAGMPISIINPQIDSAKNEKICNYSGAILLCAFVVLLISIIGLLWDGQSRTRVKTKRNSSIEFLRFVVIMSVTVHHYCALSPNGYLGVDFFFVLSGFLLMSHFTAHYRPEHDAVKQAAVYTKNRYLKIIPFYLVAFALSILLSISMNKGLTIGSFVKNAGWELLMLEGFGITQDLIVGPGWYCSSLLIAGFVIYFLLGKSRKNYLYLIAPISLMTIFVYMAVHFSNLNRWLQVDTWISTGTLRGFAEMGLGCICYEIFQHAKDKMQNRMKILSSIVELLCIIFILYVMYGKNVQGYDFICVLVMAALITSFFIANSYLSTVLNNSLSAYLGRISVSIYLNHIILANIDWYGLLGIDWNDSFIIYLCIVILFSCVSQKFVELIMQRWNRLEV